ncbi:MAG: hypothetical protein HYR48_05025 [Gemmatimonadetes bacterium]|nr:hypothetical protein [Gemmatimonadota bacterium]
MPEETYDPARVEKLLEMLRALAQRIVRLDAEGHLLGETSSLLAELGNVRSELFRYEVRQTFDTPEVAEHRRIVDEASAGWGPGDDARTDGEDPWQADGR